MKKRNNKKTKKKSGENKIKRKDNTKKSDKKKWEGNGKERKMNKNPGLKKELLKKKKVMLSDKLGDKVRLW